MYTPGFLLFDTMRITLQEFCFYNLSGTAEVVTVFCMWPQNTCVSNITAVKLLC